MAHRRREAALAAAALVVLATVAAASHRDTTAAEEPSPEPGEPAVRLRRVYPAFERWVLPVTYRKQVLIAEMDGEDEDEVEHARWSVDGERVGGKKRVRLLAGHGLRSELSYKPKATGERTVTCTFVRADGSEASVSWVHGCTGGATRTLGPGRRGDRPRIDGTRQGRFVPHGWPEGIRTGGPVPARP